MEITIYQNKDYASYVAYLKSAEAKGHVDPNVDYLKGALLSSFN
jgi:hypothetical protein